MATKIDKNRNRAPLPFSSLRILDFTTSISGPYATKMFVDAGADVIKIERPGGDPLRTWSASGQSLEVDAPGPLFQFLNAGKQSLVLDLGDALDRARFLELVARVDLLFEDAGPGELEALGLSPETLFERNPQLGIVRISPWGQEGPWSRDPATDFTLQAATGSTEYRGLPEREPVATGGRLAEWATGIYAAVSGLAVWRSARQIGSGQVADLSAFESAVSCLTIFGDLGSQFFDGLLARSMDIPSIEPTKDGHIGFCTTTGQQCSDFCSMMGHQELAQDPRYREGRERFEQREKLWKMIRDWTTQHTNAEIIELCELLRLPVAPVGNGKTLPQFDHVIERKIYQRTPAGFLQPRPPWQLESCEPAPIRPAPRLDEQRAALLAEIAKPVKRTAHAEGGSDLPFAGLRVVDFTAFWAGPVATTVLADLGADVIKIESIQRPDGMRFAGAIQNETLWEWSPVFHGANPGKRGITLRLDHADGLELAKRLIREADVVIENFSARVMPGFGLGPDEIRALNPRAIFVRMPAFGLDGPWKDRAGFAMNVEQVSGLAWVTGYEDIPLVPRGSCDPIGGMHAVFALGIALEERRRTGRGQMLEVALLEPGLNIAAEQVLEFSAFGALLGRAGNKMPHAAPQGVFATANPDDPAEPGPLIAVSIVQDDQWRSLCRTIGAEDLLAEGILSNHAGRYAEHERLCVRIADWAKTLPRDEAVSALLAAGVPASAVINGHQLSPNPQLEARHFFQHMHHPVTGDTRYPGFPAQFSGLERDLHRSPPPTLGQHTREVLQSELGIDEEELNRLEAEGVIGTRPSFM
jgi:crotonobetainyl-CoA:carnitine CoA-transferase CaiB-like acyl-CoA transferase